MTTITIHDGTGTILNEFEISSWTPIGASIEYTFTGAGRPSTIEPTAEQVADVLDKAADILETEGWGKGAYLDNQTGKRCTVGAIRHAVCGNSFVNTDRDQIGPTILKAIHILDTYIASNDPEFSKRMRSSTSRGANFVITWNDTGNRTQEDVVNALRKAANEAREKVA